MRSPVAVYERREKSRSWHRDAMAAYKGRRPEEGPDKAEPAAKTSRRRPYPVLMAWRQFISCPSPGGRETSRSELIGDLVYHWPRRYQCTYRFPR